MTTLLNRIHARVGDLWWYSAMLFIACRSGDVIQAFIGLWLVPKYVGPQELGAVLPLQQLSSFFTVPLAIVAVVFSKYVNTYATRGELGKVKSFIHDVIIVSAALMLVCIVAAYWLIPHFYSRLNIAAGSLTVLVLASGFVGNISNLFGSALQGLKKFKTMTVQSLISAPIRLVTLLVAMPFRPLSGYLLGQTTPAASCGILAVYSLHNDLKSTPPDPSWHRDLPEIWRYLWPVAVYMAFSALFSSINLTIFRQRLPEVESSAYYVITRFAEIAGFIGCSALTVLVPLASEAHEKGKDDLRILKQSVLASVGGATVLAAVFYCGARPLFNAVAIWQPYSAFAGLLSVQTLYTGVIIAAGVVVSYEMACCRFGAAFLALVLNFLWIAFLVSFTGADFFHGIFPESTIAAMKSLHVATLTHMVWLSLGFSLLQLALVAGLAVRKK